MSRYSSLPYFLFRIERMSSIYGVVEMNKEEK
jgi:hypothetical protein